MAEYIFKVEAIPIPGKGGEGHYNAGTEAVVAPSYDSAAKYMKEKYSDNKQFKFEYSLITAVSSKIPSDV